MALRRIWQPSPNNSARYGGAVRLVIVHTAEGALTHEALGNFFASSSAGVSSHTGIDDKPGECGEYVNVARASWTAGDVNGFAVQTELCAFAAWDRAEWMRHPAMLENCRQWVAEECARFGIPLVKSDTFGVCGHVDVSGPGGHWDPGPEFPWDMILGAPPAPPLSDLEDTMKVVVHSDGRQFVTNGITKRYLGEPTMEAPDMLKLCDQDGPMAIADYTIDRIPEILPVVVQDTVKVDLANINRAAEDSPVAASASLAPPTPGYDR
jgi:hypothetical protein